MYNIDEIYDYIKKNGEKSFEQIWKEFKSELISSETDKEEKNAAKTRLYMSLLEAPTIILNQNNNWDLKDNYTLEQIKSCASLVFKQDLQHDLNLEANEETEEQQIISLEIDEDIEDDK